MKSIIKTLFILGLLIGTFPKAEAQTILLQEIVHQDSVKGKWGPNLSNFMHWYIGFGFITPYDQNSGSEIYFGKANNFELGLRYKKKIIGWLAIGSGISYDYYNYRLEQNADKTLPDTLFYGKQKIKLHNLSLSPYLRINIGRRGNRLGNYIDLGLYYNVVLGSSLIMHDTPQGVDKVKVKKPDYIIQDYYGFYTSICIANRFVLYGKYRQSDLIIGHAEYADLPPLTVGVQINL